MVGLLIASEEGSASRASNVCVDGGKKKRECSLSLGEQRGEFLHGVDRCLNARFEIRLARKAVTGEEQGRLFVEQGITGFVRVRLSNLSGREVMGADAAGDFSRIYL